MGACEWIGGGASGARPRAAKPEQRRIAVRGAGSAAALTLTLLARAAVGSSNNTFGIKGVEDHCFFFRSITNASELRRRVSECFERAALPQATPEARGRAACCSQHGGKAQPCLTIPLVDQCKRGQRPSATCLSCHMKCGSSRHSRHGTRKRLAPVHDPGCDLMGPRPFHSALPGFCSPGWCSKRYSLLFCAPHLDRDEAQRRKIFCAAPPAQAKAARQRCGQGAST